MNLAAKKWMTLVAGHFFIVLAIIGAFLPIMPAIPFFILAAYFYGRHHPQLQQKLMKLPKIGPILVDWDQRKVLGLPTKLGLSFTIAVLFAWPLYFGRHHPVVISLLIVFALGFIIFIMTRKSK